MNQVRPEENSESQYAQDLITALENASLSNRSQREALKKILTQHWDTGVRHL
jgi:hypothetical protein